MVHLDDQVVEVEDARLNDLLACEGQQLLREVAGAHNTLLDLCQVAADGVVAGQNKPDQVGVAADGGQQVIEIVGDPTGQPPEPIEFLGLKKLCLELFTIGYILRHPGDSLHLPSGNGDRKAPIPDPADRSIWPDDPIFFVGGFAAPLTIQGRDHALLVGGMDSVQERERLIVEAGTAALPDRFIGLANVEQPGCMGIHQPEGFVNMLGQLAEAQIRLA